MSDEEQRKINNNIIKKFYNKNRNGIEYIEYSNALNRNLLRKSEKEIENQKKINNEIISSIPTNILGFEHEYTREQKEATERNLARKRRNNLAKKEAIKEANRLSKEANLIKREEFHKFLRLSPGYERDLYRDIIFLKEIETTQ
jgi:hypothetical protein